MIDTVRLAELNADLAGVQSDLHELNVRHLAIVREIVGLLDGTAIEQPASSVAGEGEAAPARASASPTQPPAGERRTGRGGHGVPASATTPPAVSLTCAHPGCGRTFANLQRLGSHRYQAHVRPRTPAIPDAPARRQNGHPSRRETFLCARCSRSFPTREALTQHETQVDCQPVPTRPPVSMRDTHDAALADAGIVAGLGE